MLRSVLVFTVVFAGMCAARVDAADVFYRIPLDDLTITQGKLPSLGEANWRTWWQSVNRPPYAKLDGDGEIYVDYSRSAAGRRVNAAPMITRQIVMRAAKPQAMNGRLFLPSSDGKSMVSIKFRVPAKKANPDARQEFYRVKLAHYEDLLTRGGPGAAWFRHEARQTRVALGKNADEAGSTGRTPARRPRSGELINTYAMFSGGRAMSENLQLDRVLRPTSEGGETVAVDSINGITVRRIDWKPLVEGLHPELDPLAFKIPADQHAIFFPSFNAAVRLADEVAAQGALVLALAEPRSTSARTFQRYQEQMGLTISKVARLLGPTVVQSVAMTGSDPYFRTGTDVAVLFETSDPQVLENLLITQVRLAVAGNKDAKSIKGKINGLGYRGFRSDDRVICSYVAKTDGLVIVTNSPVQLERLGLVIAGKEGSLASLDEFTFFRNRYRRTENGETAFLFLSDDAIRRWCGPRWRIATSRRTRDAAVVAELQASQLDRLVKGIAQPGPLYTELPIAGNGELTLTPSGVHCSTLGSLAFMTPIAEQDLRRVTKVEADAYRQWRDRYQNNWRWAFDPIGLRLTINDRQLGADLTVMPLIWGSDYRSIISVSQGATFAPDAGDLHPALAQVNLAINHDSEMLKRQSNMARMLAGGFEFDPLGWLGDSVGLYVDDDPFWAELGRVEPEARTKFMTQHGWRIPLALRANVSSGLKLTAFLAAVRGFIEQASPGMLNWESLTYHDQPYVKITPTERAIGQAEVMQNMAVYYSASGTAFVVMLNERVLKAAIDREIARARAKEDDARPAPPAREWIGSNLGLQVDQKLLRVLAAVGHSEYETAMQLRAWNNLFILNKWKNRYPDMDPVALHERFWHEKIICPGGGEYRWNAKWQTMESTVYGCPAAPQHGPAAPPVLATIKNGNFGVTFENQGLRARVSLER